jgi:hypothetical protein
MVGDDAERKPVRLRRLDIHKTHPALYYALMTLGVMGVALGLNFWVSNPTFNPYGIPKNIIGCIFFLIGFSQLFFLNIYRDLRMVRLVLAVSVGWMFFWGVSNAQQSVAGLASFQLPILYVALAVLQIPLLIEAPVNPMTETK